MLLMTYFVYNIYFNETIKRSFSLGFQPAIIGVGGLAVCRFKFTESLKKNLIVIPKMQTLHTSGNILHVCTHKKCAHNVSTEIRLVSQE